MAAGIGRRRLGNHLGSLPVPRQRPGGRSKDQQFPDHIQLKVPLHEQTLKPGALLLHLPESFDLILLQRPETPAPKVEGLHRNFVTLAGVLDGLAQRVHLTQNRHDLLA